MNNHSGRKWLIIAIVVLVIWMFSFSKENYSPSNIWGAYEDWGDHSYWNSSTGTVEWTPWK